MGEIPGNFRFDNWSREVSAHPSGKRY
jgi:hypothetical protein